MYLNILENPKVAKYYTPIDLDTKKSIKYCFAANDETGEYEVYCCDENGRMILLYDDNNEQCFPGVVKEFDLKTGKPVRNYDTHFKTETKKGNIRLVKDCEKDEFIRGLK
ncbi:hypothetical protein LCGC14_1090530 [marine sediment metagenome]|uniref:Uncharacterized protein n=1 Tax=marine sediment metagenome TaxID=412755 RepID=A0A0F9MH05_9ZZZZ